MNSKNLQPRISVIIPVHNQYPVVKRVLAGLEKQKCSRYAFEVVIVDDGSTDETPLFLERYAGQTELNVQLVHGDGKGAGAARNLGVEHARGEYVLFLDGDTIPSDDLILRHLKHQNEFGDRNAVVMGTFDMDPQLLVSQQARVVPRDFSFNEDGLVELNWYQYRTPNTSLRRALLEQLNGFNIDLFPAEDTEIAYRLAKLGVRFYFDESIKSLHHHPMDLNNYLKRGAVYGKAVALWYRLNPELRRFLALRYGVYSKELPTYKKLLKIIRSIVVNRFTFPIIVLLGRAIRNKWFNISHRLYQCAYRYQIRRYFRKSLKQA